MKKLNTIIITLFIIITFVRAQGGNKVTCSNGSNCKSCGNTNQITQHFMQVSFTQCTYMACQQSTSYINSFVCQSCYQAPNSISALNVGNFYNPATNACVSSCPLGTTADNTNTCQANTKPGNNISCGSSGSCSGCGATNQIQSLFTPVSGQNCKVIDCSQSYGSYNSYVCQSCYQASGTIAALNIGNFYNPATNACVASCPKGTLADNTNTCQIIPTKPGNNVSCGSSGSCSGCGATTQIQNLFTPVSGLNCKVTDCSQSPSSYNSYVCQSCYQASGSIAALNIGNYYDPVKSSCVSSCPLGTMADSTNTCQIIPTNIYKNIIITFEEEMKKLNTIIITLFIIITFVRAQGGNKVTCSNGSNCNSCGNTNQITQNFMQVSFTQCTYMACQQSTSYINSFVCQSCYKVANSVSALNVGNFYNPATNACVSSCPLGTTADNTNTCQANTKPGNNISCGSSGSCSGCGATNQIQSLFTPVSGSNCKVIDCSQSPGSYNSYVCQSCYQASGTIAALNIGNFYNPATNACVASCPKGTLADNTNTCQIIPTKPGNNVSCGSSGSCSGCGATNQIQNLFTPVSGSNCKVTDCSQSPSSYNSYVCQSCYQASGSIAALNIGNYYDPVKSSCVSSCPLGTMADSTNTCQTIPTKPGNNVSCGNSGSCLGCGAAPQIQNLFTPVSGSNCKMTDCSQSPSQYNGYVCQSCYQASGSIAALNIGNYYDSIKSACVSSCPTGTTADNTNTCQPNPTLSNNNVQCSSSGNCKGQNLYTSGNFLNLTLCFLLLNVLI
ncbi:hypothetical protein ABPG73_004505 [Tetrahymena malaccensis]